VIGELGMFMGLLVGDILPKRPGLAWLLNVWLSSPISVGISHLRRPDMRPPPVIIYPQQFELPL